MPSYKIESSKNVKSNVYVQVQLDTPIQDLKTLTEIKVLGSCATELQKEYRYSRDGISWSEWVLWPNWNVEETELTWLSFRFKSETDWKFEGTEITWIGGELLSENCSCQISSYDSNSFVTECGSDSQFLYNVGYGGIPIWEKMSLAVFNKMGWPVVYFKCDPVQESRDVVFREWSLLKVRECKQIKMVIPENDFGSGDVQFSEFDIDFVDDLEFQISKEHFWAAFGTYEQPAEKDFIYFPLEGRMFRINSVQEAKEYMRQSTWWKGTLIKWNESDSILKDESIQTTIDSLTLNFDRVGFEDEREDEMIDIEVPQQYTVRPVGKNDKCRDFINNDWEYNGISQKNISNYFTVFSKYQYDLKYEEMGVPLVSYQNTMDMSKDVSLMFWYQGRLRDDQTLNTWMNLFTGGIDVDIKSSATHITHIRVGNVEKEINIPLDDYYAYYIGFNRVDNSLVIRVWDRADLTKKTTKMDIIFESNCKIPNDISGNWKPTLVSNYDLITTIRFLKYAVPVEEQSTIFTQLVFQDSSKAYTVDDCWPVMYVEQMSNR